MAQPGGGRTTRSGGAEGVRGAYGGSSDSAARAPLSDAEIHQRRMAAASSAARRGSDAASSAGSEGSDRDVRGRGRSKRDADLAHADLEAKLNALVGGGVRGKSTTYSQALLALKGAFFYGARRRAVD
jgi:hypothetical protein